MKSVEIITKDNEGYVIRIDEDSFRKTTKEPDVIWEIEFEVYDQSDGLFGKGKIEIKCNFDHTHVSDEIMIRRLINSGIENIKASIENEVDITSIAYRFSTCDCSNL